MVDPRRDSGPGCCLSSSGWRGIFWVKDRVRDREFLPIRGLSPEDQDGRALGCRCTIANSRPFRTAGSLMSTFASFPFSGQTVNVLADRDAGVLAATSPSPGEDVNSKRLKILMLGGSSLWGFGAAGRSDDSVADRAGAPSARHPRRGRKPGGDRLCEHAGSDRPFSRAPAGIPTRHRAVYDGVNDTTSALLEGRPTVTTTRRTGSRVQHPAISRTACLGIRRIPGPELGLVPARRSLDRQEVGTGTSSTNVGRAGEHRSGRPLRPVSSAATRPTSSWLKCSGKGLRIPSPFGLAAGCLFEAKTGAIRSRGEGQGRLGKLPVHGSSRSTRGQADELASNRAFVNLSGFFAEEDILFSFRLLPHHRGGERADRRGAGHQVDRDCEDRSGNACVHALTFNANAFVLAFFAQCRYHPSASRGEGSPSRLASAPIDSIEFAVASRRLAE